jgi:DnaJ-class molecular chaperone
MTTEPTTITGTCNSCRGRGKRGDGSACSVCGGEGAITVLQGELFKKPPKYSNKYVKLDGFSFDSQAEATRYGELVYRVKAGEISQLRVHTRWGLYCAGQGGVVVKIADYESDLDYIETESGRLVVEDVKSAATRLLPMYLLHRKWFAAQFGFEITEVLM